MGRGIADYEREEAVMPQSEVQYDFETKIVIWAAGLSRALTGEEDRPFLVTFGEDGTVQRVQFYQGHHTARLREEIEQLDSSHLFFDPFDWPEYCAVSWSNVPIRSMKRLLTLDQSGDHEYSDAWDDEASYRDSWNFVA